jgi:hypothetical protein
MTEVYIRGTDIKKIAETYGEAIAFGFLLSVSDDNQFEQTEDSITYNGSPKVEVRVQDVDDNDVVYIVSIGDSFSLKRNMVNAYLQSLSSW